MTKDPICSMTVDEATALHVERDGKTFYFCKRALPGEIPFHSRRCQAGRQIRWLLLRVMPTRLGFRTSQERRPFDTQT